MSTNPIAKADEKVLSEKLLEAAKKEGWETPINRYVELHISYDAILDEVEITVSPHSSPPPKYKWGGKYDIQNIVDTVADALERRKSHDGIIVNDNRIWKVVAERSPLID